MSKGPGLFSDIGKKAKDLLINDFISDQRFTVSTCSISGVALTSTALKKEGLSTGDVDVLFTYKNAMFDVKVDTESNISTTCIFNEILPSTRAMASFIVPNINLGMLEVQYFHDYATLTTSATLNQAPSVDVSAAVGTPSFAFGAQAGYDTTSGSFTKYVAGISVIKTDCCASVIVGEKGDSVTASYVHHLERSAAVAEMSRRFSTNENVFTVGGLYAIDLLTVVKAKLNNNGTLAALLQHEVIPNSLLTISGEVDTKALDRTPRFGLALALKP